jgi:hypothetical protein
MAGFHLIIYGRFWVITEVPGQHLRNRALTMLRRERSLFKYELSLVSSSDSYGLPGKSPGATTAPCAPGHRTAGHKVATKNCRSIIQCVFAFD